MRQILIAIFLLFLVASQANAYTNRFVDPYNGNNANDGTTMDLAWQTVEYALESGALAAGYAVWVRRSNNGTPTNELPITDIAPVYDGDESSPLCVIGWPRASAAATQGDWTQGSSTVDTVVGITLDREQHQARYVTGPDGKTYFITQVVDANTFKILEYYAGSTVTGVNGAFTIQADEDYATAQAIDDSAWTIKKTNWNADAADVPTIDFNDGDYQVAVSADLYHYFKNIQFMDSTDGSGIFLVGDASCWSLFKNCLFKQSVQNDKILATAWSSSLRAEAVTVEGTGSSQNIQIGIHGNGFLKNVAVYGCGDYGIRGNFQLDGVNSGIEAQNYDADLAATGATERIIGRNVRLGGTAGYVNVGSGGYYFLRKDAISIENYGRVLGKHKKWTQSASICVESCVADGSGSLPSQRSGGAATVVEITVALLDFTPTQETGLLAFEHEYMATTASKSYRYYVQSMGALTATELWLECEYINAYGDETDEYVTTRVLSNETVAARANQADWSQYIEVTGIQPAVASKVRIRCYFSYYHATNLIFIDPKVTIS